MLKTIIRVYTFHKLYTQFIIALKDSDKVKAFLIADKINQLKALTSHNKIQVKDECKS